ncbi:MAG: ATP-binding cassette domain-containing protein [Candidatus Symbiobacter sp.]|nr:ATP-binding cassette domain-containing protein [Candidatus Symbiobacter sp.]
MQEMQESKTATPSIQLIDVYKSFGRKNVLHPVNIAIKPHRSTVIIGQSGTGKSVLLKLILGLLKPDHGQILINGLDRAKFAAIQPRTSKLPRFGMLFQGAALFDSLTVWENVVFGLIEGQGMKRADAYPLALVALAQVGLPAEVASLFPSELSGGMQKRVGLARAIATKPDFLFFDEPTTGLDPIMADVINELIRATVSKLQVTSLSITHDMASVRKIADDVAMLHQGQIIWFGTLAEMETSQNPYLQQFIHGRSEGPIQAQIRA